ncbi:unnamed protein product [Amoebophrya sp. A120]|nr:unnamed protein product [Amoebophrya sp. A120]|eukprot:GSA120T00011558001.1
MSGGPVAVLEKACGLPGPQQARSYRSRSRERGDVQAAPSGTSAKRPAINENDEENGDGPTPKIARLIVPLPPRSNQTPHVGSSSAASSSANNNHKRQEDHSSGVVPTTTVPLPVLVHPTISSSSSSSATTAQYANDNNAGRQDINFTSQNKNWPGTTAGSYNQGNNFNNTANYGNGNNKKGWVADWLEYSKFGDPVIDKFIPLKTPCDPQFDSCIPQVERFYCADFLEMQRQRGHELSLIVNLAFTKKYYYWDAAKMADLGFGDTEWWHCPIEGRKVPPIRVVSQVLEKLHRYVTQYPDKKIAIHCTHGVNRTAFFVIAYLLRYGHFETIEEAQQHFETQRGEKMKRDYLLDGLHEMRSQILPRRGSSSADHDHKGRGLAAAPLVMSNTNTGTNERGRWPEKREHERRRGGSNHAGNHNHFHARNNLYTDERDRERDHRRHNYGGRNEMSGSNVYNNPSQHHRAASSYAGSRWRGASRSNGYNNVAGVEQQNYQHGSSNYNRNYNNHGADNSSASSLMRMDRYRR